MPQGLNPALWALAPLYPPPFLLGGGWYGVPTGTTPLYPPPFLLGGGWYGVPTGTTPLYPPPFLLGGWGPYGDNPFISPFLIRGG
jgi:hypothetical protein